jgi:hypothetical protein
MKHSRLFQLLAIFVHVALECVCGAQVLRAHQYRNPEQTRAAIENLKQQNTHSARSTLLEIALSDTVRRDLALHAASVFRHLTTNKLECAALLKSHYPEVQEAGLAGMIGSSFNRSTWDQLKSVMDFGSARSRGLAAVVAGYDAGEVPASEKSEALLRGMAGIETAAGATNQVFYGDWRMRFTHYELAYESLILSLGRMPGLYLETLKRLTPSEEGNLKDCVSVARAFHRDQTVKHELRRIALRSRLILIRSQALAAFIQIGSSDDIKILEQLAREDSAVVEDYLPPHIRSDKDLVLRTYYPLREQAAKVIKKLARQFLSSSALLMRRGSKTGSELRSDAYDRRILGSVCER